MKIEDLKDSRDRAACERAQHSGRYTTNGRSPVTLEVITRSRQNKKSPTLSQMDQKATPGRRVAYDEATEREFQAGRPVNVRSDQTGWNVLPRA